MSQHYGEDKEDSDREGPSERGLEELCLNVEETCQRIQDTLDDATHCAETLRRLVEEMLSTPEGVEEFARLTGGEVVWYLNSDN